MKKETSLYLDIVRFLAAVTVFLGHVSGMRFTGGFLWQLGPHMAEAVTMFFVLSGFVIGYVTDRGENSPSAYAIARAARIYSVALPALVTTLVLDGLGRTLRPDLYSAAWGYEASHQAWQFISGFFFVNQLWFLNIPQGSDLPYWSLGYEVWYYVIFGLAVFSPPKYAVAGVFAVLLFVGPSVAAMFPLWLLGWCAYRLTLIWKLGRTSGAALFLGSAAAWLTYELWAQHHGRFDGLVPGFLKRPELIQDYLVGGLFAANLLGFNAAASVFSPFLQWFEKPIRWCAGATFTIYLFHLPIAQFLTTVVPWPPSAWPSRLLMTAGVLAIMFVIAEGTERQKTLYRRAFSVLIGGTASPPLRSSTSRETS